jgi:hypothetical protein
MAHRHDVFSGSLFGEEVKGTPDLKVDDPGYLAPPGTLRPTGNRHEFVNEAGDVFDERGQFIRFAKHPRFDEIYDYVKKGLPTMKEKDWKEETDRRIRVLREKEEQVSQAADKKKHEGN